MSGDLLTVVFGPEIRCIFLPIERTTLHVMADYLSFCRIHGHDTEMPPTANETALALTGQSIRRRQPLPGFTIGIGVLGHR